MYFYDFFVTQDYYSWFGSTVLVELVTRWFSIGIDLIQNF